MDAFDFAAVDGAVHGTHDHGADTSVHNPPGEHESPVVKPSLAAVFHKVVVIDRGDNDTALGSHERPASGGETAGVGEDVADPDDEQVVDLDAAILGLGGAETAAAPAAAATAPAAKEQAPNPAPADGVEVAKGPSTSARRCTFSGCARPKHVGTKRFLLACPVVGGLTIAFGLVFGLFRAAQDVGDNKVRTFFPAKDNPDDAVTLMLGVTQFTMGVSAGLQLSIDPVNSSSTDTFNDAFTRLKQMVSVRVGNSVLVFQNNSLTATTQQTTVPITVSGLMNYPFDEYQVMIPLSLWVGASELTSMVDMAVQVESSQMPGYKFDFSLLASGDGDTLIMLKVVRDGLFKVYPIFLIVAFWLITCTATTMLITIGLFSWRKVEPPYLALQGALLFAVPALRNTAPFAPPMGVQLDYCAFFWAMLMNVATWQLFYLRFFWDGIPASKPPAPTAQVATAPK